jgi:hypothetical protein
LLRAEAGRPSRSSRGLDPAPSAQLA